MNKQAVVTRACLLLVVAASVFGGTSAASASTRTAEGSCPLLSPAVLQTTLGQSQSTVLRDNVSEPGGSDNVDSECGWGVWTGAPPTTTTAMFAFARSGHAGQVGIETWAPKKGNDQKWIDKDYDELTGNLETGTVAFPGVLSSHGIPAHILHLPHLGHMGSGSTFAASGGAKGLTVAVGCWWEDKTYKAICVFDEEAAFRPVVAHMQHFAQIAVPKFLG